MNKRIKKFIIYISVISLIVYTSAFNAFFVNLTPVIAEDLCQAAVDVVLVMDISGSMIDGEALSQCDWEVLEGSPLQCTPYNEESLSQQECEAKPDWPQCSSPVYTEATNSKIYHAKKAANSFVNNLGANDQSGLVSFSDTASLEKGLSNDHQGTHTAINGLSTGGATNIGDAIVAGSDELGSVRANPQAVKAMILLTDGKANRPNGPGHGEYPKDVTYTLTKAAEAADLDFKIFTIGLGSNGDINEDFLLEIASTTNAQYYNAPTGDNLSGIYEQISQEICQYGSISGCKYSDVNNDGEISGEDILDNWQITLTGGPNGPKNQLTDQDGCYSFAGLVDGSYTVTETLQSDWLQTYPAAGFYDFTVDVHNVDNKDFTEVNFGNYYPYCGNDILDDPQEVCEIGDSESCTADGGYDGTKGCNQTCDGWSDCVSQQECGDGIKNGNEECDGADGALEHYTCTQSCTLEYVPYCGDDLVNQQVEECDGDPDQSCTTQSGYRGLESCAGCLWGDCLTDESCGDDIINGIEVCDGGSQSCAIGEYSGTRTCLQTCDGWSQCETDEYCGDGIKNGQEECDGDDGVGAGQTCSQTCEIEAANPECGDGIDNDGDLLIDYPDDPGCDSSDDNSEADATIIINEIIQNPYKVSDSDGEWFEVYNTTQNPIDLNGCVISDNGGDSHTISSSLVVPAQGYAVLAREGDPALNGGITPDYVFSGFGLTNSADAVILTCDQTEIDRVEYDGGPNWPDPSGASMILSSPIVDNNVGSNWCVSTSPFGDGDLGTPGAANDSCGGGPVCGNGIIEGDEQCDGELGCSQECTWILGIISGFKYKDLDGDLQTDTDREILSDWTINLFDEEALATTSTTTNSSGYFEFSVASSTYSLTEDLKDFWTQLSGPENPFAVVYGAVIEGLNFINFYEGPEPVCGNGEVEDGEQCDDGNTDDYDGCSAACASETYCASEASLKFNFVYTNNEGDGDLTENVFAGPLAIQYAGGETIPLTQNGYLIHESYLIKDVPGVALQRNHDRLRFLLYGGQELIGIESLVADIDFTGAIVKGFENDPNALIESQGDATSTIGWTGYDEVYYEIDSPAVSWVSAVNLGNDAFFLDIACDSVPVCGNGEVEDGEQCDDGNTDSGDGCSSTCQNEGGGGGDNGNGGGGGGGGGGGYVSTELTIQDEGVQACHTYATITWRTNKFSTSRVVYDVAPHPDITGELPPNYGYAYSTAEDSNKVTAHTVVITGLTPGTEYFFRAVSSASPEKVGGEIDFKTHDNGVEVPGCNDTNTVAAPASGAGNEKEEGDVLGEKIEEEILGGKLPAAGINYDELMLLLGLGALALGVRRRLKQDSAM